MKKRPSNGVAMAFLPLARQWHDDLSTRMHDSWSIFLVKCPFWSLFLNLAQWLQSYCRQQL